MPLSKNQVGVCAIIGLVAIAVFYYATQNTEGNSRPIPATQGEGQVMGMGVAAGMRVNAGTALDMRPECHFWVPGLDPDGGASCQPVKTAHRYPAIPGGNLSTVMHKGWSAFGDSAPDNSWFTNPPEAAVL
jgi:hypothetical protein